MEGVSYILLVFIAMPLKYLDENVMFMKIVGMGHGILFVLFCLFLFNYSRQYPIKREIIMDYFLYSLSPFGFWLIEKKLKESI